MRTFDDPSNANSAGLVMSVNIIQRVLCFIHYCSSCLKDYQNFTDKNWRRSSCLLKSSMYGRNWMTKFFTFHYRCLWKAELCGSSCCKYSGLCKQWDPWSTSSKSSFLGSNCSAWSDQFLVLRETPFLYSRQGFGFQCFFLFCFLFCRLFHISLYHNLVVKRLVFLHVTSL